MPEPAGKYYAFLITLVAALGGFLFGYDLVIISGAQLFLRSEFALSPAEFGFATSSAMLGCIAGPFLGAWLCDRLGRRGTLFITGVLFAVGTIGTALPRDITTFNIFRIVGGLGVGLSSIAAPMYIAEVAPAKSRGRLGFMYQLSILAGCLASVLVSYFLAKYVAEHLSWRWMFGSTMVPVVGLIFCLCFVPESPRWLVDMNRSGEALAVLARINGTEKAELELEEISQAVSEEPGGFSELLQPGFRMALLVGIGLAVFNQWTGLSGIGPYLPTIFQMAGFESKSDAIFQMLIVHIIQGVFTLLAIALVDRIGRRPLWLIASASMFFSLLITALIFQCNVTGGAVIIVIALVSVPHALGLGPLPWLMMSEIQPTRIRAKAVAISTTFLWLAGFVATLLFPIIEETSQKLIGSIAGVFLLYAGICVLAFIFGALWLPETKNKTLEEITTFWKERVK